MLRNNNRGAGLVTVVTVLAVCGILLAGVLGFAYQHYKNVTLSSSDEAELTEIELCSRLLLKREASLDAETVIRAFYASETVSVQETDETKTITVTLGTDKTLRLQWNKNATPEEWSISYLTGAETVAARTYYYAVSGGKYTYADPPAETSEETEVP